MGNREGLSGRDAEYCKEYEVWLETLSAEERARLTQLGVDAPDVSYSEREKTPHVIQSAEAKKTAFNSSNPEKPDIVDDRTPLDAIAQSESDAPTSLVSADHVQGASQILSILFATNNGELRGIRDVALDAYCLAYLIAPHLINGASESKIGGKFFTSRQTVSARIKTMEGKFGIHSGNQKSATACSIYSQRQKEIWAERKAEKKRQKRREQCRKWREKNKERVREYQAEYRRKWRRKVRLSKAKSRHRHRDKINARKRADYKRKKRRKG